MKENGVRDITNEGKTERERERTGGKEERRGEIWKKETNGGEEIRRG